jgi:sensor histidine kinase YesM
MAKLPFRPTPFFADKNKAFWRLQLLGWGGAAMLRSIANIANEKALSYLVLTLIATVTGFSVSLILSVVYGKLMNRKPLVTWGLTALALAAGVIVSAFINGWVVSLYSPGSQSSFAQLILGVFYIDLTLLAAWSGLYFAINYFLQVEEQADRLERLEAQAIGAQLAMLRYQLNPHFLFNTLNSISTLVLLKQTEPANAMLTRLSSFLRHTLVNEPGSKVTLREEIETLRLYLDIERMRFEDRLRTEFRVEHDAARGCLPSMLLQPLIENAIKYAVSSQEEGAQITLSAQLVGSRLRITVSDTGPGLPNRGQATSLPPVSQDRRSGVSSTGVGLANIRDRLAQAYGEDHRFDIRTPAEGGFTVVIEIPYEAAERQGQALLPLEKPAATPSIAPAGGTTALGITA